MLIECANVPLSESFPLSFNHSERFCRVNFHFFDTNFCFKCKIQALRDTRHGEKSCQAVPGAHYPDGCGMGNLLSPNLAYIFMAISWNQMLSDPQTHHSLPITMLMTVSLMVLALMVSLFLSCRKSPRPEARVPVPIASPPSCTPVLPYVRGLSEQLRRCPQ